VAAGELRPLVSRVLPWTRFGEALDAIRQREVQGRIVLAMPPALRRSAADIAMTDLAR